MKLVFVADFILFIFLSFGIVQNIISIGAGLIVAPSLVDISTDSLSLDKTKVLG